MESKNINQGEIYWLDLDNENAFGVEHPHPYVVIQDDVINHSRVETVVLCALTTNMKKVSLPGNVLLESGEGSLPKQSIVVVSQVVSVEKRVLGEYIGTLNKKRIDQIFAGLKLLERMRQN
jgi:mRNA interferase MazF